MGKAAVVEETDFLVADLGSMVSFTPMTENARQACKDGGGNMEWMGGSLMVDHRMANDLIENLQNDGFCINSELIMDRIFKIVVPCKTRLVKHKLIEAVTYPAAGFPLYTKEEAIAHLKRFEARGMEAWAESEERGRFALDTLDIYNSLYPE